MTLFESTIFALDFMWRPILAGIGLALAVAPLGSFVIWRRMAYFGDAIAHGAILGVALALGFSISIFVGVLVSAVAMALTVLLMTGRGHSTDTALGVMSHSALALGLVAVSFIDGPGIDLMAYLFGDILSVGTTDLVFIWGGGIAVLGLLYWRWSALLTATLNPDLARAAGIEPRREELVLTLALALVVAVAIKIVGALLIGAILIIPAAAARPFAQTPEKMAVMAAVLGVVAVLVGLQGALSYDTPTGPSIVTAASVLFCLSALTTAAIRRVRAGRR